MRHIAIMFSRTTRGKLVTLECSKIRPRMNLERPYQATKRKRGREKKRETPTKENTHIYTLRYKQPSEEHYYYQNAGAFTHLSKIKTMVSCDVFVYTCGFTRVVFFSPHCHLSPFQEREAFPFTIHRYKYVPDTRLGEDRAIPMAQSSAIEKQRVHRTDIYYSEQQGDAWSHKRLVVHCVTTVLPQFRSTLWHLNRRSYLILCYRWDSIS